MQDGPKSIIKLKLHSLGYCGASQSGKFREYGSKLILNNSYYAPKVY